MLGPTNSRNDSRRRTGTRRHTDRRITPHPFGSPEWQEQIAANYLAWPRFDRRQGIRRDAERRENDRRRQNITEQVLSSMKFSRALLSKEEIQLITDLYSLDP